MKQKVVIKVCMNGQKSRTKAMKIAVGVSGVESTALQGQDKNQIEVIGDGVDAAALAMLLRKKVGYAELVSVALVPEKKPAAPPEQAKVQTQTAAAKPTDQATVQLPPPPPAWFGATVPYYVCEVKDSNYDHPCCSIM